jgi:hypothetical protein
VTAIQPGLPLLNKLKQRSLEVESGRGTKFVRTVMADFGIPIGFDREETISRVNAKKSLIGTAAVGPPRYKASSGHKHPGEIRGTR